VTEKSLKIENQKSIVKESIYNVKGRIESVKRKISASDQISERNRQLIFDFCEHRRLQGLDEEYTTLGHNKVSTMWYLLSLSSISGHLA
jgi:hypothetical protein